MWDDPMVEETHQLRDEYAALFNYDLRAIYLDLKKKERQHAEKVVSLESVDPVKTAPKQEEPEQAWGR
jgi:hypothetical protein